MTAQQQVCIIVNADDLGMSREVNDAIFHYMDRGRVTSATLLANAPDVENACRRLKAFPRCSFGAHLNLTQFEPLSAQGRLLLDGSELSRSKAAASRSPALIRAIYEELCAQVDRLAALNVPLSHFDSHHHVHTQPHVFPALKALQRKYGIRRVRLSKNLYRAEDRPSAAMLLRKRLYNSALRGIYRTSTTAAFTELSSFVAIAGQGVPLPSSIELMAHPGAAKYAAETALLDGDWDGWNRVTLTSYLGLRDQSSRKATIGSSDAARRAGA